ncbi:MAG: PAS domain S-box protein, partial [Proteobacteria bacterium]|nr:PAS domain S-box protein [Pseudomonadota bacterium]
MTIKIQIIFIFSVILILLSAILIVMGLVSATEQRVAAAYLNQFQSNRLADQLRQSSDDLTRMARSYVETGDPIFKQYYFDILAIRDGTVPRPQDYHDIYWDFVISSRERPASPGPPAALLDLMKQTGLSDDELAKLEEAKKNSDDLTYVEKVAFGAMKGLFADDLGNLTVRGEPDPEFARAILYDSKYHEAKAEIMRPISEFIKLVDERTRLELEAVQAQEVFYRIIAVLLTIVTFLFSLGAFFYVNRKEIYGRQVAEEKLKMLADNASDIIVLHGKKGEITYITPALKKHLGIDPKEVVGKQTIGVVHPEDKKDLARNWNQRVLREGKSFYKDVRFRNKKGEYLWFECHTEPVKDEKGEVIAAVTSARNISEYKQAESEALSLGRIVEDSL